MSAEFITFGCRLNSFESEVMRRHAEDAGMDGTVIINTCAVTAEAVRQARQAIRRARRDNPRCRIIVTGCAAQTAPAEFAEMPEIDLIVGNLEKLRPETFTNVDALIEGGERMKVGDVTSGQDMALRPIDGVEGRVRGFVQIQNGCNHRCTFCVIPFGRGPSRSVPVREVVLQARRLVENGHPELVLTGVDITSYGADLSGRPSLGGLVETVLREVPELRRLRLSSIDMIEMDERLVRVIAENRRLMPHLHLSLQAGDDIILKRMKRRHTRKDAIRMCARLRELRPDIVFGADLIAGFPTETEAMFENTLRLIEECDLTYLHVFPFSPRPGTAAERMPQLPRKIVKQRAARLRSVADAALLRHLSAEVGQSRHVLVEQKGLGRTEYFARTELDFGRPGEIVRVRILEQKENRLIAGMA